MSERRGRRPRLLAGLVALTAGALLVGTVVLTGSPAGAAMTGREAGRPPVAAARAVTALAASVVGVPQTFRGSDERDHVDYDLLLTNALPAPVTVTSVVVSTADGRPLLQMAPGELAAKTLVAGTSTPSATIPASTAAAVLVDVVLPPGSSVRELVHEVTYDLPADLPATLRALFSSTRLVTPAVDVDPHPVPVIAPPLTGAGWFSANGCCQPSPHRSTSYPVSGAWLKPETYAVDWVQADTNGRVCRDDCSRNELWPSFGAPLLAVANGTVVGASDGAPDIPPLTDAVLRNREEFGGNHVVVQIGPRAYAFYGHLENGTLAVKVGDKVKTGQVLGRLGNSGNTSGPHLHFDVLEGPDVLLDRSIPYQIDRFVLAGSGVLREDGLLTVTGPARPLERAHPLISSVADFR